MKNHNISMIFFVLAISASVLGACRKLVSIDTPKNQLTTDKVFADTTSAKAALLNIYVVLETQQYVSINKYLSNYSDETLSLTNQAYNQSRLAPDDAQARVNWGYLYSVIYQSNLIIEQLPANEQLPITFRTQIVGEAKFLRAYAYFNLLNIYGKIPLITSTDANANRVINQVEPVIIYGQIVSDLTDARNTLNTAYPGGGRIRVNKACATALLAKVFLYQKDWVSAEAMTTELIGSGTYTPLETVTNAFKISGKESILQLASQSGFVAEASGVVPSSATVAPSYFFTDSFYNSFETGDQRKTGWIGTNTVTVGTATTTYRYPYKYKNRVANTTSPENLFVLRIAEQFLIRAEARANQGKFSGTGSASEDVNTIRTRAGLPNILFTGLPDALAGIANERRHELFFENGDRFMDLKRTGSLQSVMASNKSTWLPTSALFPIPNSDIITNPNLKQNAGY